MAEATVGACGSNDAPTSPVDYTAASCNSVCSESAGELVCDLSSYCGSTGVAAYMVTGFGTSTHDVSIWGQCGTDEFCCVFDETTTISTVSLKGTSGNDDLFFNYDLGGANERKLQPWDADPIDAFAHARGGNDGINGSDYGGTDYDEELHGGDGSDGLTGHGGGDFLKGGDGDDVLNGNVGWDTLWGGDGDDDLDGGAGNDVLCDATGFDSQASSYGASMVGGDGDDKLWYDYDTWTTPLLASNSDAGGEDVQDACGNDLLLDYPGEYPADCELTIDVEPTKCVGQN